MSSNRKGTCIVRSNYPSFGATLEKILPLVAKDPMRIVTAYSDHALETQLKRHWDSFCYPQIIFFFSVLDASRFREKVCWLRNKKQRPWMGNLVVLPRSRAEYRELARTLVFHPSLGITFGAYPGHRILEPPLELESLRKSLTFEEINITCWRDQWERSPVREALLAKIRLLEGGLRAGQKIQDHYRILQSEMNQSSAELNSLLGHQSRNTLNELMRKVRSANGHTHQEALAALKRLRHLIEVSL